MWPHHVSEQDNYFMFCVFLQLRQFKEDNAEVGFGSGTLAVDQSIERTIANMKWIAENKDTVLAWFDDQ